MTKPRNDAPVSREAFEAERQARLRAEAQIAELRLQLDRTGQRLIAETEAVRSALVETDALRQREASALREHSILSEAFRALAGAQSAASAMAALLSVLQGAFGSLAACYLQAGDHGIRIVASTAPDQAGLLLPLPPGLLDRSRRLAGFSNLTGDEGGLGPFRSTASALIAPMPIPGESPGALMLICPEPGRYSAADLRTLERVAEVAAQGLSALREARRNALLVSLIEGRQEATTEAGVLDAPLEAIYRAFTRLTDMQGYVVGILDDLLGTLLADTDNAIDAALARMGELTLTDRVYVFRLRPGGQVLDNTHEWCAEGIAPMQHMLQGVTGDTISHWWAEFEAGRDVSIHDVDALPDQAPEKAILQEQGIRSLLTVPMVHDGAFLGFVGYDAVRDLRNFLPGEVHLIRSVARVIASLLARRDAEARLAEAHAETAAERARFLSVLSATPDLIVEMDLEGRFVTWHSGAIHVPPALVQAFDGRLLEEVLPPDLATIAREVLLLLKADGRAPSRTFPYALIEGDLRWWQLTAAAIPGQGFLFVMRDITEARAQTAEIELLSEVARRTTNLVVVADTGMNIEWVNAAFERHTGWSLEEVRGKPVQALQTEVTDPAVMEKMQSALMAGKPAQVEIHNRSRHGDEYWVELDVQPLFRPDGAMHGFMSVETIVTERIRQADALRQVATEAAQARAILEAAVAALQDGFVLFDADDRLVICNDKYRQIYPRSSPAITPGATFESILRYGVEHGKFPDSAGREEAWIAARMERHNAPSSEIEQQLSDGRWLRILESTTPDGGSVGLTIDITALKMAEQRALADLTTAMEASHDGIAITDPEGRYLYLNRAHLEMFGFSDEAELINKPWTAIYAPKDAIWMEANALPRLMANGHWNGEITIRSRSGAAVAQDMSLTRKEDGGILFIIRDITARRHEADERDRLRDELQLSQRREIIGQMAAGLAHDFNNFLATISGSAALIQTTAETGSVAALGAGRIIASAQQAAELVKRLMMLGARPSERKRIDMRGPVTEAAELLGFSLRAPASLILDLPDRPVEAQVDPTDILQVVLNLGINARDALAGQEGEVTVRLAPADAADLTGPFVMGSVQAGRSYLCLCVADTGAGMTSEVAANAFQPWFTTKGDRGTGIGLAVVATIVSSNGGAVRVDTAPGRGTSIRLLWPVDPDPRPAPQPDRVALTGGLHGRTILVVDDQPDVLDVLVAFLEAAGAEVAPATDPGDVIEALDEDPGVWDLLITDYDMPGMTGADLADAVRRRRPDLPVILVTALAGVPGRNIDRFDLVLAKPVDRAALVSAAEATILSRRS